jgi:hypothetical protein
MHPDQSKAARTKTWAAVTLTALMAAGSAIAIANAGTGHSKPFIKIKNCSSSGACIGGNNSGGGAGVSGQASTYFGVVGVGTGQNAGVGGYNEQTAAGASGVYGQSENGFGVYGFNASSSGYGLFSQGNAFVTGDIFTGGACHAGCSEQRHQASFAARTSQPTLDDVGEGALRGGAAHVALAADFANAIDTTHPYVVLLTPEGDASLYVSNRTAGGFDVREVGGGRSNVAFAYRIVGKPFGSTNARLPFKITINPNQR